MRPTVLWDVDHTLIETRGVGRELYQAAFERVTGMVFRHAALVSGRTELQILTETLVLHGIEPNAELAAAYVEALAALYVERFAELRQRGRALPGAREALIALDTAGYAQTVVTGNLRAVATTKLEAFGLAHLLDLEVGAYAEDGDDRADLVQVALERAGCSCAVLIGDTPADAAAASANGIPEIGVATGRSTPEELRAAGAAAVLSNLTSTDEVMAAVARLTTA